MATATHEHDPSVVAEKDEDDPKSSSTVIVGLVGSLIVIISVYLTAALYYVVCYKLTEESVVTQERIDLKNYTDAETSWLQQSGEYTDGNGNKKKTMPIAEAKRRIADKN